MSLQIDRRSFLKWMTGLLYSLTMGWETPPVKSSSSRGMLDAPNVLILLFDTLSARHTSLCGYPRATTPNLAQFADRATVYHRNYSAGNFTNPGTASLLTGTYPWTHRSLHLHGSVAKSSTGQNLFAAVAPRNYHTVGYSHNIHVNMLLHDFRHNLDVFKRIGELCLLDDHLSDRLFSNDYNVAIWRERLFRGNAALHTWPTSLLLFWLNRRIWSAQVRRLETDCGDLFPRGLPNMHGLVFVLEDAIDWMINSLGNLPRPFLAYFHLLPPHDPYKTRYDFAGLFNDGWRPVSKDPHFFSVGYSDELLNGGRRQYDEYIAYVDAEFGRLYRSLAQGGLLDNMYLVVTSDHGEMFERGIWMHNTPTLYEPVVHVPLLISRPGQRHREDVYIPTSGVDLLPTLCYATGQPAPDWCEGQVLPPFVDRPAAGQRSIYVVEAKENRKLGPLTKATVAIIKGNYKLVHYSGYSGYEDEYELYDVVNDPEEMNNLYPSRTALARELQDELQAKVQEVNRPYLDGA